MEEIVKPNKLAIASLVLAVIGPVIWLIILYMLQVLMVTVFNVLNLFFILSLPIIIGIIALHQIRKSEGKQKGKKLAWIGIVVGLIEIVLLTCYLLYEIFLFVAAG